MLGQKKILNLYKYVKKNIKNYFQKLKKDIEFRFLMSEKLRQPMSNQIQHKI